jgi:hypothetical protein
MEGILLDESHIVISVEALRQSVAVDVHGSEVEHSRRAGAP